MSDYFGARKKVRLSARKNAGLCRTVPPVQGHLRQALQMPGAPGSIASASSSSQHRVAQLDSADHRINDKEVPRDESVREGKQNEPEHATLQQVVPEILETLSTGFASIQEHVSSAIHEFSCRLSSDLEDHFKQISAMLMAERAERVRENERVIQTILKDAEEREQRLTDAYATVLARMHQDDQPMRTTYNALADFINSAPGKELIDTLRRDTRTPSQHQEEAPRSSSFSQATIPANCLQTSPPLTASSDQQAEAAAAEQTTTPSSASRFEGFRMDRTLVNLSQVWQEYVSGINGQPSVREVEQALRNSWRTGSSDTTHFMKRRQLYREVERLVATGLREDQAVDAMEAERVGGALTLDQYRAMLSKRATSQTFQAQHRKKRKRT